METHRDLDGHPLVDAVLVVEVDAVYAEPLEAALARRAHVRRVPADVDISGAGEVDAELGAQLHLLPHPALQRLAEEDLVGVRAIDVGGVEQGDSGGDGVVDELDHVGLGLGRAVEGGHAHAAEALRRDLQPLGAQLDAANGHGSVGGHGRQGAARRSELLLVGVGV